MSRENFRAALNDSTTEKKFLQLVREARAGSGQAIGELFDQCRPYLLAIANAELDAEIAGKVGASDLVQNSFLSAQRRLDDFGGNSREELLQWLRVFLINDLKQTRRHYRAAKRNVACEQPLRTDSLLAHDSYLIDDVDSPSTAASDREQEQRLYRALQALSEEERMVIDLRNWQRLGFAEIGKRMNRSADAARKFWSRAIVRLEQLLESGNET